MILHYLQHAPFEGLGSIAAWAEAAGHPITATRLYAGDLLPAISDVGLLVVMGGPMNVYLEVTREGAEGLIDHCRGDFEPPGSFVQRPQNIIADERRFSKAHQLLLPLLADLTALA